MAFMLFTLIEERNGIDSAVRCERIGSVENECKGIQPLRVACVHECAQGGVGDVKHGFNPQSNEIERNECTDDGSRDRVADDYANSEDENGHLAPPVSGSLDPMLVLSGH